jgi:hypothetical protein
MCTTIADTSAPPKLEAKIDAWCASEGEPQPSRSQAIRFLLEKGLAKGRGKP